MYLTLEVVSPQAASLGADRRRIVSERGLTIGRVPGNDWIIPDPYISKQHARVSFANGGFFVEGLGRNAIAIGSPGSTLPPNQPHPLRSGDRLFIDQYEMIVTTMQGDPPGAALASDDPFAVLPVNPSGSNAGKHSQPSSIPDVWNGGIAGDLGDTGVLDPLDVLGGSKPPEPDPLPPVNWQRASPLEGHFEPPPVRVPAGGTPFDLLEPSAGAPAAPPAASSTIPDSWDRTNLTYREGAVPKPPPAAPRPLKPSPAARPASRETPISVARPAPVRPREVRPVVPEVRSPLPGSGPEQPLDPRSAPRQAVPESIAAELSSGRAPDRQPWPATRAGAGVGTELQELLRGAGLSTSDMSPEMMQDLGKVLRVVVEGVMDVLRARAEIKSQFRLPMTRIKAAENNPLKHSPNVESALHTLLVQRNPGFLPTVQAFEDAFADIRNHQMAMLEGLRVAYDAMLASFDPKELEKGFERPAKRGFGSTKSKYWDLYAERFTKLGTDADDTFRRLFGDVFAEAYEKQLERLKLLGRNGGKT
jgi:type VI secretion system FHA domain protein